MQRLRGRGWVNVLELSSGPVVVRRLLENGWIERDGVGLSTTYRLTEEGLAAKSAPVPIRSR
jgi:hypothetical protein